MADKPILFSAPMVLALLDGRKTQTRRLIKDRGARPEYCGGRYDDKNDPSNWGWEDCERGGWITLDQFRTYRFVPYTPGDRLWVREAWAPLESLTHSDPGTQALCDGGFYRADNGTIDGEVSRWRPSIHMPRWASRLTLIVTDVRVQRLQEIGLIDARAEGAPHWWRQQPEDQREPTMTAIGMFRTLWNTIHGPDAWDANPWVCALTFDVHRCNIAEAPQ